VEVRVGQRWLGLRCEVTGRDGDVTVGEEGAWR